MIGRTTCLLLVLWIGTAPSALAQGVALVEQGSPMTYQANASDPGLGSNWTAESFDDSSWPQGVYGVGYETASGAENLIATAVPPGTVSVYTRARFDVPDVTTVSNLYLGADYDDGYVAWINGVEVYRSAEMPAGTPAWDSIPLSHESSNGASPDYGALVDISGAGIPALHDGTNVIAVGVWNRSAGSSDLVVVPKLVRDLPVSVSRGPYLQIGSSTSIVVRWRTASPSDSQVRYGVDPADLNLSEEVLAQTIDHEVTLSGLAPDTRYYYSVGSSGQVLAGGDAEHFFHTPPVPGTRRPLRAWVIGDSGTSDANARAVRDAYASFNGTRHTDLWLMLGDNAYADGTDSEYQTAVFDMYPRMLRQSVVWPTFGNHDGHSASSATLSGPYYDIFTLPTVGEAGGVSSGTEAYYSFDVGNVHFISLNSHDVDRSVGGAMLTWLEQDLSNTFQDWTIAFWHHPPYTKGSHDSDTELQLREMRENALPILEDWGVDLVLSGHSHSYERSYLLDGHYGVSSTLTNGMKLDGGDGRTDGSGAYSKPTRGPAPHEGATYVVAGSSGKTSPGSLDHPAMYRSLRVLGSVVLDVEGDRLEAKFIDDQGTLQDYFTIVKNTSVAPQADFDGAPTTGPAPLVVSFSDRSTTNTTAWAWDFDGDGLTDSTEREPTYSYASPGSYTVRLTTSNASGSDTRTRVDYIVVTGGGSAPPNVTGLRRTDRR